MKQKACKNVNIKINNNNIGILTWCLERRISIISALAVFSLWKEFEHAMRKKYIYTLGRCRGGITAWCIHVYLEHVQCKLITWRIVAFKWQHKACLQPKSQHIIISEALQNNLLQGIIGVHFDYFHKSKQNFKESTGKRFAATRTKMPPVGGNQTSAKTCQSQMVHKKLLLIILLFSSCFQD